MLHGGSARSLGTRHLVRRDHARGAAVLVRHHGQLPPGLAELHQQIVDQAVLGRLGEEAKRINEIFSDATEDSLILLNYIVSVELKSY